ncbi:hypothetical protein G4V39_05625 [Thermosulfuriphilus ammonigenes]|uniref:Uncharacterized protein n=1 Tax=Thermosulfuriphilus ammonigenes TaxID=1936021 RepID=A0A6G7PWI3_9BACT|nr:hypothetical protein [Thermosulfuriphilus ammonigenes]MBA2848044.1 chromosome segregation ATPase [Thermosulfuriphilus ammonigenes]QIJ71773.1 hypothetical protein G4V39_05625 [Thermosulfuriphilus ammonigenes]HFB83373.1 hypothetical protein [Thermodesulfatator sp.]
MEITELSQLEERLERLLKGYLELKRQHQILQRLLQEREAEIERLRQERALFKEKVVALIDRLEQVEKEQDVH